MKRAIAILFVLGLTLIIIRANAQGRGRGNGHGHGNNKHEWKDDRRHSEHYERDNRYSYDRRGRHQDNHSHRRDHHGHDHYHGGQRRVHRLPAYAHNHSRHCGHTVVVRRYTAPRYVYYRDHDVYFDHHRNVFISYSGRGWTITTGVPAHLHHINLRTAVCHEVEYYDDDFVTYLDHGRPMYGKVYVSNR